MKVSRDRINWTSLGDWYDPTKSIFAMNSDVLKFNDTYSTVGGSGYRRVTNVQLPESRVINVSGLILADEGITTVREREREIRSLIVGEELYFLDEYYNLVLRGSVPNINTTPDRGNLRGKSSLVNFNINALDPYWTSLARSTHTFVSQAYLEIDYAMDYAVETNYTIKFTCKSSNTVVTELVPGKIAFSAAKTIGYGDVLTFSTEDSKYTATWKVGSLTSNILSSMTDAFYLNQLILTPGVNGITINSSIENYFDVEVSYYGRSR